MNILKRQPLNIVRADGTEYPRGQTRLRTARYLIEVFRFIDQNPCVSVAEIARQFDRVCERTVRRYVTALEQLDLIEASDIDCPYSQKPVRIFETTTQRGAL